ncbi:MAG: hypothetical protein KIT54_05205 [Phycisphaeraceae bacterium]|nr:hypothetical protein [Phycisphaeraceae bacterium]
MAVEKICIICGTDCSGRPRLKDPQGQYACQACVEAQQSPRQPAPAAKKPRPRAPVAAVHDEVPSIGAGFDMDQFLEGTQGSILAGATAAGASPASHCPGCGASRAAGAVVCMQCGFDSSTGKAIGTKVRKAKVRKARRGPRISGGSGFMIVAVAMLVLLPLMAMTSTEAAAIAFLIAALWNLAGYIYMVVAAFRDGDAFWGIIGVLVILPLVGGLCALAFVLYYCTIGSERVSRKLNYWSSFLAVLFTFGILAMNNPALLERVGL